MMKHFGHKGLVLGAVLGVLAWAFGAQAAGYEVRLPVEKTVRLAPPPETPSADAVTSGRPASPVVADKKVAGEKNAAANTKAAADTKAAPLPPRPEAPKPEAAKPEAAKAETPKAETSRPKASPVVAPKPAPKPLPRVDPLALETPPAPAPHEPTVLPERGNFVGDVEVEFQSDRVILRVATNGAVERVTSFGVKVPRKLALDLHGPWRKKGPPVVRFSTGPVKNVVAGEHPDRLRLSLEFREGVVEPDMQPTVEKDPKGLTVSIPLALHLRP